MVKVCSSLLLDRGDARVLDPAPLICVDEVVVLWCGVYTFLLLTTGCSYSYMSILLCP